MVRLGAVHDPLVVQAVSQEATNENDAENNGRQAHKNRDLRREVDPKHYVQHEQQEITGDRTGNQAQRNCDNERKRE